MRLLLHTSQYLRQQLAASESAAPALIPVAPLPASLTKREREILALLARGCTLPQIGEQLCISPDTVRNQCVRLREKLGLRGRNSLMAFAMATKVT